MEVAIGTGYPFGDFFQKQGYSVYGIDISLDLIAKCKKMYPDLHVYVGDAEDLHFPDNSFNCTYCFHSTWYFPNLSKAIEEMIRVTALGGIIMVYIQNRNNAVINDAYLNNLARNTVINKVYLYAKNIAKIILRKKKPLVWNIVVHEVPTYPEVIYAQLEKARISEFCVMAKQNDSAIVALNGFKPFPEYPKLVFVITK